MHRRVRAPRVLLALAVLLILLPALAYVPSAAAATCTVTNTANSGPNTLRAAIANSDGFANCDTITITATGTITLLSALPLINRLLVINGPGMDRLTIQGDNTFALLTIDAPAELVVLSGLTLTKGRAAASYGGNLRVARVGMLTITDVALTGGTAATGFGGAGAYIGNGQVTLTDVIISGNTAPGSAQYGTGAGLYIDDFHGNTTVTIVGGKIYGNIATSNNGGGVAVVRNSGVAERILFVRIINQTVIGDAATPNRATAGGGAGIYASGGVLLVQDSTVQYNYSDGLYDDDEGTGGGLLLTDEHGAVSAQLIRAIIMGNVAHKGGGGGVAFHTEYGERLITLTVTASAITGNTASNGGGLNILNGKATLTNTTISGNTAHRFAGGIHLDAGSITDFIHVTITGNTANGTDGRSDNGGGIGGTSTAGGSMRGSIVAGNRDASANQSLPGADCNRAVAKIAFVSAGDNIFGKGDYPGDGDSAGCKATNTDRSLTELGLTPTAVLSPTLAPNDGPTRTHALVPGGPAVDLVTNCTQAADQRGQPRPQGVGCDAGAYELVQYRVTTDVAGTGTGTVSPAGGFYPLGTPAVLRAVPSGGSTFTGWAIDGTPAGSANLLTVPLDRDRTVVANFAAPASPAPSPSPSPGGPVPQFRDVPADYWSAGQIAQFAQRGITTGCGVDEQDNPVFCPERGVTRAEMATFLMRALGQDKQTPPATPTFADVPADYWAYGQIEAFVNLGITTGCGTNDAGQRIFCPDRGVTRAEMAAFLDRAKGQTELPSAVPTFADVPPGYWAYGWIERFFTLNITTGCGEDDQGRKVYCPDRGVTRAEMAVFIIRAYP